MVHRIEDGDVIKILPFIVNGIKKWGIEIKALFTKSGQVIYDDDTEYLKRLCDFNRTDYGKKFKFQKKLNLHTRYYFNALINGEIKVILIGRTIMNIIKENPDLINLYNDKHLFISKEDVSNVHFGLYNYSNTYIIDRKWHPKFISDKNWHKFIVDNQPDFITFIKGRNPFEMKNVLIEEFGRDIIDAFSSKERDQKLEQILIR